MAKASGKRERFPLKFINQIFIILKTARDPRLRWWRLFVAASWFSFGLAILLYLSGVLTFTYHSDSGIVGWLYDNKYPKQQEITWFLLAILGIPGLVFLGQIFWGIVGFVFSQNENLQTKRTLPIISLCHLPFWIVWPDLLKLKQDCLFNIALAVGISFVCILIAGLYLFFWQRRNPVAEEAEKNHQESKDELSNNGQNTDKAERDKPVKSWRCWFRRISISLRVILFFFIIPIVVYHLASKPPRKSNADLFHEGEFVIPMQEFMAGDVPYRDIYLQHGLMHNLGIPWLGAKIYGPTLTGVRLMRARIEPLGAVGFYFLLLMLTGCHPLPILLYLLAIAMQTRIPARAFFGSLSLAFIAADIRYGKGFCQLFKNKKKSPPKFRKLFCTWLESGWYLLFAGALMVIALLHSVEIGLYCLGAGGIFIIARSNLNKGTKFSCRLIPIITYIIGAGIVLIPFLFYLAIYSAVDDFVYNLWIQCIYQLETWGRAFPGFFQSFRPLLTAEPGVKFSEWIIEENTVWYLLPILLTLANVYLAYRAMGTGFWKSRTAPFLLLLALSAAAFFRTPLGRSDRSHLHYGYIFAVLIFIFCIDRFTSTGWSNLLEKKWRLTKRLGGIPKLLFGLVLAVAFIWWIHEQIPNKGGLNFAWERLTRKPSQTFFKTPEDLPEKPQIMEELPRRQARHIRRLVNYIQSHTKPEDTVFDFSNHTGLLLFAERRPTSKYFHVAYASLPALQEEVISDLKKNKPPVIIYYYGGGPDQFDRIPNARRHPIVHTYLKKNYKPAKRIGNTWFWQLR